MVDKRTLTEFFMDMECIKTLYEPDSLPCQSPLLIKEALDKHFKGSWAWELEDDMIVPGIPGRARGPERMMTTVTVYTPGRIFTGRSLSEIAQFENNHLYAIYDAVKSFVKEVSSTENNNTSIPEQPKTEPEKKAAPQLTAQDILNLGRQNELRQQEQQKTEPKPMPSMPMGNHSETEGVGIPAEIPFEQGVAEYQQAQEAKLDIPNPKLGGFTQRQVNRINGFKKKFDVTTDQMFIAYIHTWNNEFYKKSCLTPANVEDFLAWTETVGEM